MKTNSYRVRKPGSGNYDQLDAQIELRLLVQPWCFMMVGVLGSLDVVVVRDMPNFWSIDAIDDGLVCFSPQGLSPHTLQRGFGRPLL